MKRHVMAAGLMILVSSQVAQAREQVFLMASEQVGNRPERDVIDLTNRSPDRNERIDPIDRGVVYTKDGFCHVGQIMIDIDRDGVDIRELVVEFGNGQTQPLQVGRHVGERHTQWIDLHKDTRCIRRIYLTARSDRDGRGGRPGDGRPGDGRGGRPGPGGDREPSMVRFFGCVMDKRPQNGPSCSNFNPDRDERGRDGRWGRGRRDGNPGGNGSGRPGNGDNDNGGIGAAPAPGSNSPGNNDGGRDRGDDDKSRGRDGGGENHSDYGDGQEGEGWGGASAVPPGARGPGPGQ